MAAQTELAYLLDKLEQYDRDTVVTVGLLKLLIKESFEQAERDEGSWLDNFELTP